MSKITYDYNRQQIATFQQHPDNISATFYRREKEKEELSFSEIMDPRIFSGPTPRSLSRETPKKGD